MEAVRSPAQVAAGIADCGVVAVVRTESAEDALGAVRAVLAGGVRAVEITFTVPGAEHIIARLHGELGGDLLLGAGTVTTREQAQAALAAGAEFLVSPALDPELVSWTLAQGRPFYPGVFTPSEILAARQLGVEVFKIFPASRLGPAYLRDLQGPFPGIKLMPTGGIDAANAADYLKAGAFALGVGGKLVDRAAIRAGDWEALTRTARELMAVVAQARAG